MSSTSLDASFVVVPREVEQASPSQSNSDSDTSPEVQSANANLKAPVEAQVEVRLGMITCQRLTLTSGTKGHQAFRS